MSGWAQGVVWVAGAIITLDALLRLLGGFARRTFRRWHHARAQLDQLAANTHVGYFTSVLGVPALKRSHDAYIQDESALTEYVYLGVGFYVQAITDDDDRVLVFTVTMRDDRLKAKVQVPNLGMYTSDAKPVELTLGRSRLADVPWMPGSIYATIGANRIVHRECYYLANPGNYQSLVISWNDAGSGSYSGSTEPVTALAPEVHAENTEEFLNSDGGKALRREVTMNTYGITAPLIGVDLTAPVYGVDLNDVRVLDGPSLRRQLRRRAGFRSTLQRWRYRLAEHG